MSGRWSGQRSDQKSVRSGLWYGQGCGVVLFGLAKVCSVWAIPIFGYVRSGQYLSLVMFGLANTYLWLCSVWPMPVLGMVGLANACLGYGRSGQCLSWVADFILGTKVDTSPEF